MLSTTYTTLLILWEKNNNTENIFKTRLYIFQQISRELYNDPSPYMTQCRAQPSVSPSVENKSQTLFAPHEAPAGFGLHTPDWQRVKKKQSKMTKIKPRNFMWQFYSKIDGQICFKPPDQFSQTGFPDTWRHINNRKYTGNINNIAILSYTRIR